MDWDNLYADFCDIIQDENKLQSLLNDVRTKPDINLLKTFFYLVGLFFLFHKEVGFPKKSKTLILEFLVEYLPHLHLKREINGLFIASSFACKAESFWKRIDDDPDFPICFRLWLKALKEK